MSRWVKILQLWVPVQQPLGGLQAFYREGRTERTGSSGTQFELKLFLEGLALRRK